MSRVQARVTLPEELQRRIAPLRERCDPEKATGNPAHVTIIYHDEAPDPELLEARLRVAAREFRPFPLVLGRPARFEAPARGVFLEVSDATNSISSIRNRVLQAPFSPRQRFGLHVTVLHPDQGQRLDDAWQDICGIPALGSFQVSTLQLVGSTTDNKVNLRLVSGEETQ